MKCIKNLIFIFLLALAQGAIAEAYRCTDAQGNVTYTNTECQAGADVQKVKDQTSVVDTSKQRQFVEQELARAKAKVSNSIDEVEPELSAKTAQLANLEKLKQADSLIKTAVHTRDQLWMLAVILIGVALVSLIMMRLFRRRKKRNSRTVYEITDVQMKPVTETGKVQNPAERDA
jgi:hypothetical protein